MDDIVDSLDEMITDGRCRVSLPRRTHIGGAAAEVLPARASGEHKAKDGDPSNL